MQGCDVVFHTAGIFTYWARDQRQLESVVLEGTRNALEAAGSAGRAPVRPDLVVGHLWLRRLAPNRVTSGTTCATPTRRRTTP